MRKLLIVGLAAVSLGCGSASSGTRSSGTGGGGRNVLTAREITERGGDISNAFEALERLRPDFLRMSRGPTDLNDSSTQPSVYINSERQPSFESLRVVAIREVSEIRKLSASEAQTKFGLNNTHGAIQVVTIRH